MTLDPTVNYSYDSEGNLSTVERTAGDVTQHYIFAYDIWGNRTSVAVGTNRTLASYAYGAGNGNLQTMTYGNGDAISYTYDTLGRVCTATYKNAAGDTTRVLTYTYTGDGQLYAIYDSATEDTTYYTYDSLGRLIASTDNSVRTNATYNAYNQLISQRFSSPIYTATETYTYDTDENNTISDGTLMGMDMVNGDNVYYEYDTLGRLTYRELNSDKAIGGFWERYTYDGTHITEKKNWIDDDTVVADVGYAYDTIGNIIRETDLLTGATISYSYDSLGQLTGVTHSDGRTEAYTYDKAGNIRTFNNGSGISHSMAYTDSQWKDLLTAVDGQTITYDAIGNPTNYYNGYTFTWAEGRRLQSATVGENQTYGYQYNADGLRTKKTNADGSYIVYHIAGSRYLGEIYYTATGAVDLYIRYNYDENGSVVGISLWNEGIGQYWTDYYFEKNLQGDILNVYQDSDSLPTLVASYTYDTWGNILTSTGSTAFDGRLVKDLNPFRYRGYYYDAETWFYYVSSRYYDPAIGRWISPEPNVYNGEFDEGAGLVGYNVYAYCANNPVMFKDVTGEFLVITLSSTAISLIAAAVVTAGTIILFKAHRTLKNGSKAKTNDKHTKPRPGRESEKKKQKDGWKSRK